MYLLRIVWILISIFRNIAVTLTTEIREVIRHRQLGISKAGSWQGFRFALVVINSWGLEPLSRLSFRDTLNSSSVSHTSLFSSRSPETWLIYSLFASNTWCFWPELLVFPPSFLLCWVDWCPPKIHVLPGTSECDLFGNRTVADVIN